jgi:hypothetical protein
LRCLESGFRIFYDFRNFSVFEGESDSRCRQAALESSAGQSEKIAVEAVVAGELGVKGRDPHPVLARATTVWSGRAANTVSLPPAAGILRSRMNAVRKGAFAAGIDLVDSQRRFEAFPRRPKALRATEMFIRLSRGWDQPASRAVRIIPVQVPQTAAVFVPHAHMHHMRVGPRQHIENKFDHFENGLHFCLISPFLTPKMAL